MECLVFTESNYRYTNWDMKWRLVPKEWNLPSPQADSGLTSGLIMRMTLCTIPAYLPATDALAVAAGLQLLAQGIVSSTKRKGGGKAIWYYQPLPSAVSGRASFLASWDHPSLLDGDR